MKSKALSLLAFLFVLSAWPQPALAQAAANYCLTGVEAAAFPEVTVSLRATGQNLQALEALTPADFTLYEDGQPIPPGAIQVRRPVDGAVDLVLLIDQGQLSNYGQYTGNRLTVALDQLVTGGYFQDGLDQVSLLVHSNFGSASTREQASATRLGAELSSDLQAHPFNNKSTGRTNALNAMREAIEQYLPRLQASPGPRKAVLLLLTRYVEGLSTKEVEAVIPDLIQLALQRQVSIYVVQTDLDRRGEAALRDLASRTGGAYLAITPGTAAGDLDQLYRGLMLERAYFTAAYRSRSGASAPRLVALTADASVPAVCVAATYQVNPASPAVVLQAQPSPVERVPMPVPGVDPTVYTYPAASVELQADFSFPDAITRSLTSAEVWLGATQLAVTPNPTATLTIPLDVSDILVSGTVTLTVRVTDELGLIGVGVLPLAVWVQPMPSPPAPAWWEQPALLWAVVLLLLAGICGLAWYIVRRLRALPLPSSRATLSDKTVIPQRGPVLATLTVLEGPSGLVGVRLPVVRQVTVIGRNPEASQITFYAGEESTLSRVHCELTIKDNQQFVLIDRHSSSGTWRHGRQLPPDTPVPLEDGDEIILGDLAQRGVKLRFELANGVDAPLRYPSADDPTYLPPADAGGSDDQHA